MLCARLRHPTSLILALTVLAGTYQLGARAQGRTAVDPSSGPRLAPTAHPAIPGDPAQYLFVPTGGTAAPRPLAGAAERLVRGIRLIEQEKFDAALPLLTDKALDSTPLFAYGKYYAAVALHQRGRLDEADATLIAASAGVPVGHLGDAVPLLRADIAMAKQDARTAVAVLESMLANRVADPAVVLVRLGAAAEKAGDAEKAIRAYRRVYFEFPLGPESQAAASALSRLPAGRPATADLLPLEIERAEALFTARRWAESRDAFERVARLATRSDERDLASLRLAECDVQMGRARQARSGLAPHLNGPRRAEARYFDLLVTKATASGPAYVAQARRFIQEFSDSAWTEEALNALATHLIMTGDDAGADQVFRELLVRFPRGRHAERAGWKVGWTAYRAGRFAETAAIFDIAAANAPRADFRPSWLYWSARAYEQVGDERTAGIRYRLTATDYFNSYYGRLASRRLTERGDAPVAQSVVVDAETMPSPLVPSSLLVRELVGLGLHADALREIDYAQRVWGRSPALDATAAWIRHRDAGQLVAMERFQHLRGAINQMKRAYPQYLAAGGETLPPDVLKIIFPLDYWPLIKAQAEQRGLDPYLMAALVAQESTFTADIRSSANAYGLMQIIPATGRRYAAKVGIRGFSLSLLTTADTNVRLGMTYFKDLMDRFGGAHFALAGYNAGEHRVVRWKAERPGVPQDEFIDDIPFPETQNYVKRILGTAEDYRRLYGGGVLTPGLEFTSRQVPASTTAQVAAPRAAPSARVTPGRTTRAATSVATSTRRTTTKAPVKKAAPSRATRSTRAR